MCRVCSIIYVCTHLRLFVNFYTYFLVAVHVYICILVLYVSFGMLLGISFHLSLQLVPDLSISLILIHIESQQFMCSPGTEAVRGTSFVRRLLSRRLSARSFRLCPPLTSTEVHVIIPMSVTLT